MSVKDKHGNNIRREGRVVDLRPEKNQEGRVVGTAGHGRGETVYVEWDSGEEESVRATDLKVR